MIEIRPGFTPIVVRVKGQVVCFAEVDRKKTKVETRSWRGQGKDFYRSDALELLTASENWQGADEKIIAEIQRIEAGGGFFQDELDKAMDSGGYTLVIEDQEGNTRAKVVDWDDPVRPDEVMVIGLDQLFL